MLVIPVTMINPGVFICLMIFSNIQLSLSFISISSKVLREHSRLDKTYVQVSIYKNGTKPKLWTFTSFPSEVYTELWEWRNIALYIIKPANSLCSELTLTWHKRWSHSSTEMGSHNSQCLPFNRTLTFYWDPEKTPGEISEIYSTL